MKRLKTVELGPQHKNWPERTRTPDPHVIKSFPPAVRLEMYWDADCRGFFLLSIAENGVAADSWHQSVEDAMDQAQFQYGVEASEWVDVDG